MIVIFGSRSFGKTDVVPGVCYVSTKFFHVQFIPLIPLESHIVVAGSEKDGAFRGKQISLNGRSILTAWARAATFVAGVIGAVVVLMASQEQTSMLPSLMGTGLCWGLFAATYKFGKASVERSIQLARELGIEEEHLEKAFGADALQMARRV